MKVYFSVDRIRPDQRQYRQTEIELVPFAPLTVGIEIPDDLVDFEVETTGGKLVALTLAGLKEIVQQCDLVFMGTARSSQSDNDEFDWEELKD